MTTLRFIGDWSLYLGLPAALLLGTGVWFFYRRESRRQQGIYRWLLPAIRTIAVIMLVLMLTGPVLHHRWVVGRLARILPGRSAPSAHPALTRRHRQNSYPIPR